MWTAKFWKDAAERAIRTAAQTALGVLGGLSVASDVEWGTVALSTAIAVGLSILMSLLGSIVASSDTASLIDSEVS